MSDNDLIRQMQLAELEMLKEAISFFEANQITYYAIGGTLLGAIRHKGFIPWDEDVDLGVPREDYDKLMDLIRNGKCPLNIKGPANDENCYWYPARIESSKFKVRRIIHEEEFIEDICIDLFPLDGLPEKPFLHRLYWWNLSYRRMRFNISRLGRFEAGKSKLKNLIKKTVLAFVNPANMNKEKEYRKFDQAMKKYGFQNMPMFLNAEGRCEMREIAPSKWLGEAFFVDFEDIKLRCIEHYDEYLTKIYGNYMEKPKDLSVYGHNILEIIATE